MIDPHGWPVWVAWADETKSKLRIGRVWHREIDYPYREGVGIQLGPICIGVATKRWGKRGEPDLTALRGRYLEHDISTISNWGDDEDQEGEEARQQGGAAGPEAGTFDEYYRTTAVGQQLGLSGGPEPL